MLFAPPDLTVDVLDGDLEPVKAPSLRDSDFSGEIRGEILVDDTVTCGKESENVRNKVAL